MKFRSNRSALIAIFILCFLISPKAQTISPPSGEVEVKILKESVFRGFGCYGVQNEVVDEEKLEKLAADKTCPITEKLLALDLKKHTLLSFHVRGDCLLRANARVFRNDQSKIYSVRVKNIWGGCRSAGAFQDWLVIDKIPPGYKVEFVETRIDRVLENEVEDKFEESSSQTGSIETLETREIDLKGCIQTIYDKQLVIRDEETFLKAVRRDASREWCLKNVEKIDFARDSLLGIDLNSGYCRRPAGLEFQTFKDTKKKQYLFSISYLDPRGSVCRALSQYDLWVLVPKIPAGFGVEFAVIARP